MSQFKLKDLDRAGIAFLKKQAFSLIELLIVITIIGILAVALLPTITQGPSRARDVQRITAITDIALALELYYQDRNSYPAQAAAGNITAVGTSLNSYFDSGAIPTPPNTSETYQYKSCNSGQGYIVWATVENPKNAQGYAEPSSFSGDCTPAVNAATPANNTAYAVFKD